MVSGVEYEGGSIREKGVIVKLLQGGEGVGK